MEDEAADIELLEQHLNKTSQISQRMTGILSKFDTRLVKLEKTILPLHDSTQSLTRIIDNIDRTLKSIEKVASNQETAASEEALILRGPQPGNLSIYTDALDRLNANFAFAADRMPKDAARLLEAGVKKLTQLYTKLVAEGSSGTPNASPDLTPSPFPPFLMTSLLPVVTSLRTFPLPASHPSHPAAPGILATLTEAQKGYADMRGQWGRKCLETQSRRVLERVETMEGVDGGREFGRWVEGILRHAEASAHALLVSLVLMPTTSQTTFDDLLQPLIQLFQSTLNSFSALVKRSLRKYTFLALSSYTSLSALQSWWDEVMGERVKRRDELKEGLHGLRGVCLRSFPEFLADIKLVGARPSESQLLGIGVADLTVETVKYLKQIPEVEAAVVASLATLGDGNWKMGEGVGKVGKMGGPADGNERVLLEHYIYDVVVTLIGTLSTLSKTGRRPQMGSIYALNNISYLRNRLIDPSEDSTIVELLSRPTRDILNSTFRTSKAAYFDSNFSPLIQALADDKERGGGLVSVGGGKSAMMKEKWSRFFDALEEVAERHRVARVLADDPAGRDMLEEEVVRLVIPALLRFTQKNKEKEFSKSESLAISSYFHAIIYGHDS
ncbi:hypothetical protein K439DRAFT_1336032 [Ramaria rubella]|nr:hypothetical protein K439DRAFT_1336032 [Ramaria rubella]